MALTGPLQFTQTQDPTLAPSSVLITFADLQEHMAADTGGAATPASTRAATRSVLCTATGSVMDALSNPTLCLSPGAPPRSPGSPRPLPRSAPQPRARRARSRAATWRAPPRPFTRSPWAVPPCELQPPAAPAAGRGRATSRAQTPREAEPDR